MEIQDLSSWKIAQSINDKKPFRYHKQIFIHLIMKTKQLLLSAILGLAFLSQGFSQDQKLIDKYIREEMEPMASVDLSYNSGDFVPVAVKKNPKDELSLSMIQVLKDSFAITANEDYLIRTGILYKRLNNSKLSKQYFAKALKSCQTKLEKSPKDSTLLSSIFLIYLQTGQIDSALVLNEKFVKAYPHDTVSATLKSFLYLFKGDYSNSILAAKVEIERFPERSLSYLFMTISLTFQELGKLQTAKDINEAKEIAKNFSADYSYIEKAAKDYPNNLEIQMSSLANSFFVYYYQLMSPLFFNPPDSLIGFRFKMAQEDKVALNSYADKFKPWLNKEGFTNTYIVYYTLGTIALLNDDFNTAVDYLKKAIEVKGPEYRDSQDNVAQCYNNIIASYHFRGDLANAELWTRKKIEDKASGDPLSKDYLDLARFRLKSGDLAKGEELLMQAIGLDSSNYEARVDLGNIYMLKRDLKQAEYYLNQCYLINPDYPALTNSLILHCLMSGDKSTAEFLTEKLLNYNPENKFALEIRRDFLKK
jgi:Flp pilus assembly protein TadD